MHASLIFELQAALEAEARRCERYLHSSSSSKLLGVVVKSTLQQHQQELLEKDTAIPFLLAGEGRAELRLAHRLFALVDGAVEDLAKQFKMYISACGEKVGSKISSFNRHAGEPI